MQKNKRCKMSKTVRRIGSTDICSVCGKEYTVNGARQKYCKDCAEEATKKVVRAHKIEYNRAHKETLYPHKEKMRNNGYVCVVCGKVFDKSTPTVTCSPECRIQLKKSESGSAIIGTEKGSSLQINCMIADSQNPG